MVQNHLELAGQSYLEHFKDSIGYCGTALKASWYFFCHAFFPNTFTSSGSSTINKLQEEIESKMERINSRDLPIYEPITTIDV